MPSNSDLSIKPAPLKTVVIIPTYNERENIEQIVPVVFAQCPWVDILVVDDSSPDKTADVVKQLSSSYPQLHLLLRKGKEGLGRAYLAGFAWALEQGYEAIVEMDADFSHRPEDLVNLLNELSNYDCVLGSRWVPGGSTVNWGWLRQFISRGGSFYARAILHFPLRDWTGGFNAWKANVLRELNLETIESEGYSFQIELKYRALKRGFKCKEVPIVFEDRRVGQSKMSLKIVIEALFRVWKIRSL